MSTPELSPEARDAVRGYMLSLVALPSAALAIIMFLLGFFTKEVAFQTAYNKAFADANERIMKYVENAATAGKNAETASQLLAEALTSSRIVKAELDNAKALADAKAVADQVATALLRNVEFVNRFRTVRAAVPDAGAPIEIRSGGTSASISEATFQSDVDRQYLLSAQVTVKALGPGEVAVSIFDGKDTLCTATASLQKKNDYITIPVVAPVSARAGSNTLSLRASASSGQFLVTGRTVIIWG